MPTKDAEQKGQRIIVSTGDILEWMPARKSVEDKGGLPPHALLDDVFVKSNYGKNLGGYIYWARELLIYPSRNGMFTKGIDIVDGKFVFPASFMPEEAIGVKKVALFVDPIIEEDGKRLVISAKPDSIKVLHHFVRTLGQLGEVDEATRIPLDVASKIAKELKNIQMRQLCSIDRLGIRPLARNWNTWQVVYADSKPNDAHRVAYVDIRREE